MQVVVIQYETRRDTALRVSMKYTEEYCAKHGYLYVCPSEEYNLPTYWVKVYLLQQVMKQMSGEELYVAWLDSDAVFVKPETRVEDLFPPGKDFVTSLDPGFTDAMNAGVFFVRRTPTTIQLVDDWMASYDPTRWKKDAHGKWTTDGRWAGPDYEQGSFNVRILPEYRSMIALQPESMFACYDTFPCKDTIVSHFMYKHKWKLWVFHVRQQLPEILLWLVLASSVGYAIGKN
jgi:hypothetical protein